MPNQGGWLAPAGDAAAFAHAILRAAHLNDDERAAIARHNRAIIEQRADWHANTRLLLSAYDAVGKSPKAPRKEARGVPPAP